MKGVHIHLDPHYVWNSVYTTASDVYSFGLVLLQVVCGKFDVQDAKDIAAKIR